MLILDQMCLKGLWQGCGQWEGCLCSTSKVEDGSLALGKECTMANLYVHILNLDVRYQLCFILCPFVLGSSFPCFVLNKVLLCSPG